MSNVFIVGPESAGKTVLTTMLVKFLSENPNCGIKYIEKDIQTKKYTNKELTTLQNGEWPASTKGGSLLKLSWVWQIEGYSSLVTLIDPPGQDIRSELCGNTNKLNICQSIEDANLVVLVIDLIGHYDENNNERKIENAFIAEQVLLKIKPNQSLIVILTKSDLLYLSELPIEDWTNKNKLINLINKLMPQANLQGVSKTFNSPNCHILAVSAVDTINDDTGLRKPLLPLRSKGFENLVIALTKCLQAEKHQIENIKAENERLELEEKNKQIAEQNTQKGIQILKYVGLIILVFFVLGGIKSCWSSAERQQINKLQEQAENAQRELNEQYLRGEELLPCNSCSGSPIHKCHNCGGDGEVGIPFFADKCTTCNGKGKLLCSKCNGKGNIKRKDL